MGALPEYLQQSWPTERQLTRYRLSVPVRIVTSQGSEVNTTCLDVSEGGLGAKATAVLAVGQEAAIEFQLPDHDPLLRFKAIVRHWDPDRCGFEFLTNTPEQRRMILEYGLNSTMKKRPRLML